MQSVIAEKINLHKQYWDRNSMKYPIAAFRIAPDFMVGKHFKASRDLLNPGDKISANMIDVDLFIKDYENAACEMEKIDQDAFWVVEPFTGFPWMEAICGCEVYATSDSFITGTYISNPEDLHKVRFDNENPWYYKYMEFSSRLFDAIGNKYPVGQPIMRGVTDVLGAIIGHENMIYAMYDYPDEVRHFISRINDMFLKVIEEQQSGIQPFYGGYSMGFYYLWYPGKCIWFQEDLSSLISPGNYEDFVKSQHERICGKYSYNAIHLHSSSFHIIEKILEIDQLKAIEINKDICGLTMEQMVPVLRKIQSKGKNLIIWGDIGKQDIDCLKYSLEMKGIFLSIVVPDVGTAQSMAEYIKRG